MSGVAGRPRVAETVEARYRGFVFTFRGQRDILVSTGSGRRVGVAYTPAGARRLVRYYRKAT